jgi:hypothetical protein
MIAGTIPLAVHTLWPHARTPFGLYVLAGLAALVVFPLAFMTVVAMLERQYLSGDVEPTAEPFPYTPSRYWLATRQDAARLGLIFAGDCATKSGTSLVKGLQSFWLTPDHQVLVSIVSGAVTGAKLKKTVLRTRLSNSVVLESCDSAGLDDFSGVVDRAILLNAGVEELLSFHRQRLVESRSNALPFNPNKALQEFEQIDLERGARLVALGMARWVDQQQTSIRLTPRGAFTHVVKGHFRQMEKLKAQSHRMHILRAGSRPQD